jgi:hypothetical protein
MKTRWRFNLWLLLQCVIVLWIYVAAAADYNIIHLLAQYDITKISFGIICLYMIGSFWIGGHMIFGTNRESCDWPIFISENLITIGLLGTLIGLMISIGSLFGLDLSNATDAAKGIQQMSTGVSVAMITTLVGIFCTLLLKIQLLLWDKTMMAVENAFFTTSD